MCMYVCMCVCVCLCVRACVCMFVYDSILISKLDLAKYSYKYIYYIINRLL